MPGYSSAYLLKCSNFCRVAEFPEPDPPKLEKISPTLANDLLACAYRAAFRLDKNFAWLRRPSVYSELGTVAHAVVEEVSKGALREVGSKEQARTLTENIWDRHAEAAARELALAWEPAQPPSAREWPGYYVVRTSVVRRALRTFEREESVLGDSVPPSVEQWIEDAPHKLHGKPDRVEYIGSGFRVVDLKTGLQQREPTTSQRRQLLFYAHLVQAKTGKTPKSIAIEDPGGRRWEEDVRTDELGGLVKSVLEKRAEFQSAQSSRSLRALASPSPETCQRCPYRVVCSPYWRALLTSWGHGSVSGAVIQRNSATGAPLVVRAFSPTDTAGETWTLGAVPELKSNEGQSVHVADAEITERPRHLRWRWSTVASPAGIPLR
jgi:RecB family exonuclease